jgi:hypothetical protein
MTIPRTPLRATLSEGLGAWGVSAVLAMLLEPAAQFVAIQAVRCRDGANGCVGVS